MMFSNQLYKFTHNGETISAYLLYCADNCFHICKSLANTGAFCELNVRINETEFEDKTEIDVATVIAKIIFQEPTADIEVTVFENSSATTVLSEFTLDNLFNIVNIKRFAINLTTDILEDCTMDEQTEILHNKQSYEDNLKGYVSLSLSYLVRIFGDSFVWTSRTAELVGYSKLLDQFVIIDDGMCFNDYDQNTGWHTLLYSFRKSDISAQDWFENEFKFCTLDNVDTKEFSLNGIDYIDIDKIEWI